MQKSFNLFYRSINKQKVFLLHAMQWIINTKRTEIGRMSLVVVARQNKPKTLYYAAVC